MNNHVGYPGSLHNHTDYSQRQISVCVTRLLKQKTCYGMPQNQDMKLWVLQSMNP